MIEHTLEMTSEEHSRLTWALNELLVKLNKTATGKGLGNDMWEVEECREIEKLIDKVEDC